VLLDEGPLQIAAGDALRGAGFEVTLAVPTEAVVDEIARRKVKCVLLNLGVGATAWHTLKALRERVGTRNVPVLAYVMTPQSPAGFCFGRAEYALWPNEPARVVERLVRMRPKLKRLLVASADVDGMGKLRGPLGQEGISSSMVLDGKQALEFVAMTDPEAAILHVSPSCSAIARAVIGLRTDVATRDLPLLVLLDKTPAPGEDAFFAGTNRQLLTKPFFQFSQLPEEIARLVG
jgi:CheY-like chemotaxis protein